MDEKIKTWTLRFPAKENPNMEKALFDWPIVLQYDKPAKNPCAFASVRLFYENRPITFSLFHYHDKKVKFVFPTKR